MTEEKKYRHLELIQGVINRLSTNSFLLKAWSVILISALLALSASDSRDAFSRYIIIALVFWSLDGFFLWQEKLYRKLYDHVRVLKDEDVDFSMDTTSFKANDGPTWRGAAFSKTLILFHGVLILAIVVVIFLTMETGG